MRVTLECFAASFIPVADNGSDTDGRKDRPPAHIAIVLDEDIAGKQRRGDFVNPSRMARLLANDGSVNFVALLSEIARGDRLSMGLRIHDEPNRLRY